MNQEQARLYRAVNAIILESKLGRVYSIVYTREGYVSLVLLNLWRIDKNLASSKVEVFKYSLNNNRWQQIKSKEVKVFDFRLVPFPESIENLTRVFMGAMLDEVMKYVKRKEKVKCSGKDVLDALVVKQIRSRWTDIVCFMKVFRKILWTEILDREILKHVCSAFGYRVSLAQYLHFARNPQGVVKVSREHPNLIPLLWHIDRNQWHRDDLFSARLWVSKYPKDAWITKKSAIGRSAGLLSFRSMAAWRWLLKAQISVVRAWSRHPHPSTIQCLVGANVVGRIPALALNALIYTPPLQHPKYQVEKAYERLFRLYLRHCQTIWKESGWVEVRKFCTNRYILQEVKDWLTGDDGGIENGSIFRLSSWKGLKRHCNEWHQRYRDHFGIEDRELLKWSSLLDSMKIDNFHIEPLTSSESLFSEGDAITTKFALAGA